MAIGHRWLAIPTCVLFVAWLISGVVMMYVGFPELTAAERAGALENIRWRAIRISPDAALQIASARSFPQRFVLEMMAGEPVYRVATTRPRSVTVSAHDGRVIERIGAERAAMIARQFGRTSEVRFLRAIDRDQWTVAQAFDPHRPLFKFAVADGIGTEIYISSRSGEAVLDTRRTERAWNRVGAVVHWVYFTELRKNPRAWRQVVLWVSGIGILVIVSGLWLGISSVRVVRQGVTPFRGWLAWHHLAGLFGGVFLLTWVFSGWLSLDPDVPWHDEVDAAAESAGLAAYSGHESPTSGTTLEIVQAMLPREPTQAAFTWLTGRAWIVVTDAQQRTAMTDGATGQGAQLSLTEILAGARRLVPGGTIGTWTLVEREDSYWYSHHSLRRLPVLRVTFDDEQQTWAYIDPQTGAILARLRRGDRIDRWLFSGLHRWDFGGLGAHRPLWDSLMITLTLAGLLTSVSGAVMGWRRVCAAVLRRARRQDSGRMAP